MSDSVLALILIVSFFAAMAVVRYFKTLDGDFWQSAQTPLVAGALAGGLIWFLTRINAAQAVLTGVTLTLAALYVRLTGRESEPSDGMILGALTGAAAAGALIVIGSDRGSDRELYVLATCILSGAVAGFGITIALSQVGDRMKQLGLDALTAAGAVLAAQVPAYLNRTGFTDRRVAYCITAGLPLLVVATVFKQWSIVKAELRHEAQLGVIGDEDVRPTAHPLLRFGRAGWTDAGAHRAFVRLAQRIALRKRQQRGRPEEIARLYQLEILKLRMQLHRMVAIDRAARAQQRTAGAETSSDTMHARKA
jgi:hypothetical protein